jgi:hypothetical protein
MGSPDDDYIDEDASNGPYFSPFPYGYGGSTPMEENNEQPNTSRYKFLHVPVNLMHACLLVTF